MVPKSVPVTEAMLRDAYAKHQARRAPKVEAYSGAERWTPGKPVTVLVARSRRVKKGRS